MANPLLKARQVADGIITNAKMAAGAALANLADGSVTAAKLAAGVANSNLGSSSSIVVAAITTADWYRINVSGNGLFNSANSAGVGFISTGPTNYKGGVNDPLVDLTSIQTLVNKTLTDPRIGVMNPVLGTGTVAMPTPSSGKIYAIRAWPNDITITGPANLMPAGISPGTPTFASSFILTANDTVLAVSDGTYWWFFGASPKTAWTAFSYSNSWFAYGGGFSTPGWWIDHQGVVHLRGLLNRTGTPATGEAIATGFPAPTYQELFTALTANGQSRLDINTAGQLLWNGPAAAVGFCSVSGLQYRIF